MDLVVENVAHAVPFFSWLSHSGRGITVLYHVHQSVLSQEVPRWLGLTARSLEKTLRYRKGPFVAISEATKHDAIEKLGIRGSIRVIRPGLNPVQVTPKSKRLPPTFVFVGNLKAYKRVDTIIEAFSQLSGECELVIIGGGYDRDRLENKARGVRGVKFLGRIPENQKLYWYQVATANVIASGTEGFGLTILEAAASGTPTVAPDLPVFRESIENGRTGFLVPLGDVDAMTRAMKDSVDNPELGTAARVSSMHRTWDDAAAEFSEMMEDLDG